MAWTKTPLKEGQCVMTNGNVTLTVNANFGGYMENESGDFISFYDFRTLIEAGEALKTLLPAKGLQ